MRSTKIFIAILFLIGVLFEGGVMLGATHNDDQTYNIPPWVSDLGGLFASPQPVKMGDLQQIPNGCLQGGSFRVSVGGSCAILIKQSSFVLRKVLLKLVQGSSAMVTIEQEGALPVHDSLGGIGEMTKDDLKVYPGKGQGTLVIQCLSSGNSSDCQLDLE